MKKPMYLDCAATTPLYKEVAEEMELDLLEKFHNPSALYKASSRISRQIDLFRDNIKFCLGASNGEVYFTSGGSESNNWVIKCFPYGNKKHIITSSFEHHSVLRSCEFMEKLGFQVDYIKPGPDGIIKVDDVIRTIRKDTALISIMSVNNVLGTKQPIKEIVEAVKKIRPDIAIHTDAVQLVGQEKINVEELGVDFLSASAHKFHGPKGVGFLYSNKKFKLQPLIHGGGQEFGMRAGTENYPSIKAMNKALSMSLISCDVKKQWCDYLFKYLSNRLKNEFTGIIFNGSQDLEKRMSSNICIALRDIASECLVVELDQMGILCSVGSACDSGDMAVNYVLDAIDVDNDYIEGGLRLTFDEKVEKEDCDYFIECLKECLLEMRGYL